MRRGRYAEWPAVWVVHIECSVLESCNCHINVDRIVPIQRLRKACRKQEDLVVGIERVADPKPITPSPVLIRRPNCGSIPPVTWNGLPIDKLRALIKAPLFRVLLPL